PGSTDAEDSGALPAGGLHNLPGLLRGGETNARDERTRGRREQGRGRNAAGALVTDDDQKKSDWENRRQHQRVDTVLSVDYASGDTFLFSYITNISVMGIFIQTLEPFTPGTMIRLRFAPPAEAGASDPG